MSRAEQSNWKDVDVEKIVISEDVTLWIDRDRDGAEIYSKHDDSTVTLTRAELTPLIEALTKLRDE